jgi:hypothetical protein
VREGKVNSENFYEIAKQFQITYESPSGKEVLEDLQRSFMFRTSHFRGDSHETAFREGQRDVILRILKMLEVAKNPDKYLVEEGKAGNSTGPVTR